MSRNSARDKRRGARLTLVRRDRRRMRPTVFELEPRALLATLFVSSPGAGEENGSNLANAMPTIQSAITAAGTTASTILVYDGVGYNESDTIAGNQILDIEAPALQAPVLNGFLQTSPGFTIAAGASVTISGLTIQDFQIIGNGAAINTSATHLTLTNDTIEYNGAFGAIGVSAAGGGIANYGGDVALYGVTLDDNAAYGGDGASGTAAHPNGYAGGSGLGGGLATFGGQILISGSTVGTSTSPNYATGGDGGNGRNGATYAEHAPPGGAGGNGGNGQGGGIYATGGASLVVLNSTFDNVAVGGQGGQGGQGGAAFYMGGAGGIGGNGGNGQGGAVFNTNGSDTLTNDGIINNVAIGGTGGHGGNAGFGFYFGGPGGNGGNGGNGQGGGVYNGSGSVITAGGAIDANFAYGGAGGNGGNGGNALSIAGPGGNGGNGGNAQGAGLYSGAGAIAINSANVAFNYAGAGSGGHGGHGGTPLDFYGGDGGNGGNGGNGQGGGVYIGTGALALNDDVIAYNTAEAGVGGDGGAGGFARVSPGANGSPGATGLGQGGGVYLGVPSAYVFIDTFIGDNSVSGGPGTGNTNVCYFC